MFGNAHTDGAAPGMLQAPRDFARRGQQERVAPGDALLDDAELPVVEHRVATDLGEIAAHEREVMLVVDAAKLASELDAVLSVDSLRLYKPRPEVYQLACDFFDVLPPDVVFVSSNRWDVMGADAFGFRTVWVNRAQLPDEYGIAVRTVSSLTQLTAFDWTGTGSSAP